MNPPHVCPLKPGRRAQSLSKNSFGRIRRISSAPAASDSTRDTSSIASFRLPCGHSTIPAVSSVRGFCSGSQPRANDTIAHLWRCGLQDGVDRCQREAPVDATGKDRWTDHTARGGTHATIRREHTKRSTRARVVVRYRAGLRWVRLVSASSSTRSARAGDPPRSPAPGPAG